MARSEKQKQKLLYEIKILQDFTDEQHPIGTQEMIDRLAGNGIMAERKSIYSDMEQLIDFGYDINLVKSRSNGGYYLGVREFELPELNLLVDAVQASRYITSGKSRELIGKIEKLCSSYEAQGLKKQVYVSNRIKTDNESIYYDVDMIHRAIRLSCQIAFQYMEWTMDKKLVPRKNGKIYEVSPWALTCNDDNYYMVAYDSDVDMIKHFRVDKIGKMEVLDNKLRLGAKKFEEFDIARYTNHVFGMYGGEEEKVTLEFPNEMAGIAIDRFGKEINIHRVEKEHFHVCIDVAVSRQFYGWLAGIGPEVKIIAPEGVKRGYREYLQKIADTYTISENKENKENGEEKNGTCRTENKIPF